MSEQEHDNVDNDTNSTANGSDAAQQPTDQWQAPQTPYWHGAHWQNSPYASQAPYGQQPAQPAWSQQTQYGQPQYAQYPQYTQDGQYGQEAQFAGQAPYGYDAYGRPVYWAPAPQPKHSKKPWILAGVGAAVVAGGLAAALIATSSTGTISAAGVGSASQGTSSGSGSTGNGSTGSGSTGTGNGSTGNGYGGYGGSGSGTNDGNTTGLASATTAQTVGVVDIDTVLKYQSAKAAGTGMVITSSGEILTNNHVVDGATSITVTVISTGKTYTATVVGTDPTDDVALIKIDATGLKTIKTSTSTATVGATVTGVGNAGGVGGTPSAAPGSVTAVNQTITASDESGANAETLNGLIETNADIQAGDSGGPLFNSSNEVIGMDTAASASGNQTASQTNEGYAIPITKALSLVAQMAAGKSSSTIHLGYPAFLGISVEQSTGSGAVVAGVVDGLPAAQAGLVAGDVITALGGTTITSPTDLTTAMATHKVGDKVSITYTDQSGASHTATVTLVQGPAD